MHGEFAQRLNWHLFSALDGLTRLGKPVAQPLAPGRPQPAIWLFISTIGEMNAIGGFLERLATLIPAEHWVILSDRKIYRSAYLQRFPSAQVVEISDDPREAAALAAQRPPALLLVAEIPLQPSDAPCRLPYAWAHSARRHGAALLLLNGWPYRYQPSCRADLLERKLLGRAWLRAFDLVCIQDQAGAEFVLAHGARPASVHITGNMKFDALAQPTAAPAEAENSLASWLQASGRPSIVAGSVTDAAEQELVLAAFALLRQQEANARLLLAPRHPENPAVMTNIAQQCQQFGLSQQLRSAMLAGEADRAAACLVLDTMGELRTAFRFGAASHIGRDHNLLEPLCAGLPVSALPDWNSSYPSYPVFKLLAEGGDVALHDDARGLADCWLAALRAHTPAQQAARAQSLHQRFGGATERSWQLASPYLNQARARLGLA